MSFNNKNNQYNTRYSSGRYNTPGQFVPAAANENNQNNYGQQTPGRKQFQNNLQPVQQQQQQEAPPPPPKLETPDVDMNTDETAEKPHWMKVKKISNKERRRRQNRSLRRLLTPKTATMALNEIVSGDQQQVKVGPSAPTNQFFNQTASSFCADITIEGNCYKGYGENRLTARNAAAEQAIRDLFIKKMKKAAEEDAMKDDSAECDESDELPMIQVASYALHKLFADWGYEGLPLLKNATSTQNLEAPPDAALKPPKAPKAGGPKPPKPPKALPANARAMHPCMLLTYLRPGLAYCELDVAGDSPQNMMFTMGVDVDGTTYVGKACNKKEARRLAATAACKALYNVTFEQNASVAVPVTQ